MTLPRTYLAACTGLLIVTASGCSDATAQKRDAAQAKLASASTTLAEASRPYAGPEEADSVTQGLNRAVSELNAITGGAPGQQAAVSVLTAQARRELAAVNIAAAKRIESDNRIRRHVIDGMVTAAARLDVMAGALESTDVGDERSRLQRDRRDAQEALRAASRSIAELDGPIANLVSANRDATDEVARLRREANDKRRQANDLGASAGLAAYEQAIALDRQADGFENEIAQRELQLRYDLQPRHAIATRQAEALTSVIESLDDANASMDSVVQGAGANAARLREHFAELYHEIQTSLQEIEQRVTSTLADHYDRAASDLETATSKARAAANQERQGDFPDSARLEAARAQLELADINATRARGVADHIELLASLRSVPGLASLRGADPGVLTQTFEAAKGAASDAYTQAQELLGEVRTRTAQSDLDTLQRHINNALATLAGRAPAPAQPAAVSSHTPRSGAGGTGGAASPQEIVSTISGLSADTVTAADIVKIIDYVYPDFEPQERELFELIKVAVVTLDRLEQALKSEFGTGLEELMAEAVAGGGDMPGMPGMGGMGLPMGEFGNMADSVPTGARLGEISGSRGELIIELEDGSTDRADLIQDGGRWYIVLPDDMRPEPQELMAMQMMFPMGRQILGTVDEFTSRVSSGEFATIDEFKAAVGAAAQAIFQQMMGGSGMPGMPGMPGERR